jgi:hypothetical protein
MTGTPSPTWAGLPRWALKTLAVILGLAAFFFGLSWLSHFARDHIRSRERYTLALDDIVCSPPPGMNRKDFLEEVQYVGALPTHLALLDEGLARQLAAAFAKHPWVESVEGVEIGPDRSAHVRLVYRLPVLAVIVPGSSNVSPRSRVRLRKGMDGGEIVYCARAVDRKGILLPAEINLTGLPILTTCDRPPRHPSGLPWGDARVEAAASVAAFLKPFQDRLRCTQVQATPDGLTLVTQGFRRVLWGQPPGAEKPNEAPAAQKVERLLRYCKLHGGLDEPADRNIEHDVRPRAKPLHRPVPFPDHP